MLRPLFPLALIFAAVISAAGGLLYWSERRGEPAVAEAPAETQTAATEGAGSAGPRATEDAVGETAAALAGRAGTPGAPAGEAQADGRADATGDMAAAPPRSEPVSGGPGASDPAAEGAAAGPRPPTFDVVRVEPSGDALLAGRAEPGASVEILSNGEVVASATADAEGAFLAIPDRVLTPGNHELSVRIAGSSEPPGAEQRVAVIVPGAPDSAAPSIGGEEQVAAVPDSSAPGRGAPDGAAPGGGPNAGRASPERAPGADGQVAAAGEVAQAAGAGLPGANGAAAPAERTDEPGPTLDSAEIATSGSGDADVVAGAPSTPAADPEAAVADGAAVSPGAPLPPVGAAEAEIAGRVPDGAAPGTLGSGDADVVAGAPSTPDTDPEAARADGAAASPETPSSPVARTEAEIAGRAAALAGAGTPGPGDADVVAGAPSAPAADPEAAVADTEAATPGAPVSPLGATEAESAGRVPDKAEVATPDPDDADVVAGAPSASETDAEAAVADGAAVMPDAPAPPLRATEAEIAGRAPDGAAPGTLGADNADLVAGAPSTPNADPDPALPDAASVAPEGTPEAGAGEQDVAALENTESPADPARAGAVPADAGPADSARAGTGTADLQATDPGEGDATTRAGAGVPSEDLPDVQYVPLLPNFGVANAPARSGTEIAALPDTAAPDLLPDGAAPDRPGAAQLEPGEPATPQPLTPDADAEATEQRVAPDAEAAPAETPAIDEQPAVPGALAEAPGALANSPEGLPDIRYAPLRPNFETAGAAAPATTDAAGLPGAVREGGAGEQELAALPLPDEAVAPTPGAAVAESGEDGESQAPGVGDGPAEPDTADGAEPSAPGPDGDAPATPGGPTGPRGGLPDVTLAPPRPALGQGAREGEQMPSITLQGSAAAVPGAAEGEAASDSADSAAAVVASGPLPLQPRIDGAAGVVALQGSATAVPGAVEGEAVSDSADSAVAVVAAGPLPLQPSGDGAAGGVVLQGSAAAMPGSTAVSSGGSPAAAANVVATGPLSLDLSIKAAEAEADTLYVAGAAAPGTRVRIFADEELVGEAQASEKGAWLVEARKDVPLGQVVIRADVVDAVPDSPAAQVELPFVRYADGLVLEPLVTASAEGDTATAEGAVPQPAFVIIRRGDNLWRISKRNYGRGIRYHSIFAANRDQIRHPDRIYPGQVFVVPTRDRRWGSATN